MTVGGPELVCRVVRLALRIGEPDAFPAADLGLRRAIDPTQPASTADLAERAEAWRPYRGVAAIRL